MEPQSRFHSIRNEAAHNSPVLRHSVTGIVTVPASIKIQNNIRRKPIIMDPHFELKFISKLSKEQRFDLREIF